MFIGKCILGGTPRMAVAEILFFRSVNFIFWWTSCLLLAVISFLIIMPGTQLGGPTSLCSWRSIQMAPWLQQKQRGQPFPCNAITCKPIEINECKLNMGAWVLLCSALRQAEGNRANKFVDFVFFRQVEEALYRCGFCLCVCSFGSGTRMLWLWCQPRTRSEQIK